LVGVEKLVESFGELGARRDTAGNDCLEEPYKWFSMMFTVISLAEEHPTGLDGTIPLSILDMLAKADGSPDDE
jgi:hypothetical protein